MEAKSKKTKVEKKKKKDPFTFISDLKEELKKVSWTTRTELLSATKIVVLATFCFGIGIYVVDLIVKGFLEFIKRTLLFIFG
ncbi:MAG: Protein translocase subunit SecE [Chlamydiae bacterium]|nr:Protein translocase subunit SecE [Chlamydiota bacterium]